MARIERTRNRTITPTRRARLARLGSVDMALACSVQKPKEKNCHKRTLALRTRRRMLLGRCATAAVLVRPPRATAAGICPLARATVVAP